MSNNIAYFNTVKDSEGFCISDSPWIGYIQEEDLVLWTKKHGMVKNGLIVEGDTVVLRGSMNPGTNWEDKWASENQTIFQVNGNVGTCSLFINTSSIPYEFKIVENGIWRTNTTTVLSASGTMTFSEEGGYGNNAKLKAVTTGLYTFTWNFDSNVLTVTYPDTTPYTVHFVNDNHWETPYVYAFTEGLYNAAWPGQLISEIGTLSEPFDGYTVYSIQVDNQYSTIIFNNGESLLTGDLHINDKWYYNTESKSSPLPTLHTYSVIGNCNICNKPWIEDDNSAMSQVSAGVYKWEYDRVHMCKEAPAEYKIFRNGGEWAGSYSRTIQLGESDPKGWYKVTITLNTSTLETTEVYELTEEDTTLANYVLATSIEWGDYIDMLWDATGTSLTAVLPISELDTPATIGFIIKNEDDDIYAKGAIISRLSCTLKPLDENTAGDRNSILIADAVGDYTIVYYPSLKQISVTYPETPDYDLMFMYTGDNPVPRILVNVEDVYTNTLPSTSLQPVRFELNQTQYYLTSSVNADTNGIPIALTTEYTDSTISVPNGAVISVNGSTDCTISWEPTEAKLYFKPNSNWESGGARFAAYFFGNEDTWASMTNVSDGIYEVEIPDGYTNVIFCRMTPTKDENNWDNKWNQTNDLTIPTDGSDFYILDEGGWDNGSGVWSTYVAPSSD